MCTVRKRVCFVCLFGSVDPKACCSALIPRMQRINIEIYNPHGANGHIKAFNFAAALTNELQTVKEFVVGDWHEPPGMAKT